MTAEVTKGSVLIVDDQAERAANLVSALKDCPFTFDIHSEVLDLEATLGPDSPWDCVLCNVDLMNVSWASVRRAMRNFDVQVPVIGLADDRGVEAMTTALGLGASEFIVRPQERAGLLKRSIERCVNHHRLQRELKASKEGLEEANAQLRHSLRVLEQDQQAGRQVQMALLPATQLLVDDYWISHRVFTSLYLSGDFADYFKVGDSEITFFLADVSGHGSSSAFATVLLKNLFARKRSDYLRRDDFSVSDPVTMLDLANRELLELELNKYATMVVGCLNYKDNVLRYSVAGHLPQPLLISDDSVTYLAGEGPPVGLLGDAQYSEQSIQLPKRFILSVFSDGILELLEDGDLIAKEEALLSRITGPVAKPNVLVKRLGLEHFDRTNIPDDVAALFISRGLR